MNEAIRLAALLSRRGVIAVPTQDERVRAWLSGARHDVTVCEAFTGAESVWAWEHGGRAGTHPLRDGEGAAAAIEQFLKGEPAVTDGDLRPTPSMPEPVRVTCRCGEVFVADATSEAALSQLCFACAEAE
jgi:hypothetical protein